MINTPQDLSKTTNYLTAVPQFLQYLTLVLILLLGAYRVLSGHLTMGMLVAFQSLVRSFMKATYEADFRQLLLNNPDQAIAEVSGKAVPEDFTIKFVESDEDADETFVIPPLQDQELEAEELDQVAGGGECDVRYS